MPFRLAFQLSTSISSYNLDGTALLFKPRVYKAEMTDDPCLQLGLEYSYVLRVLEEEEEEEEWAYKDALCSSRY